jgi:hypothetical protein
MRCFRSFTASTASVRQADFSCRLATLALLAALPGCVNPSLDQAPEEYALLSEAQIPAARVESFLACVMDGFAQAHWAMTQTGVRQQRRPGKYRIESTAGARSTMVVVDVTDDGHVALHEARAAMFINTQDEKSAFAACVSANQQ